MATIPAYIGNQRRLDTGNVIQYPQGGGPIGAALENAGSALTSIAARFQKQQEQKDGFDAAVRENELTAELALKEDEAVRNAPADASGLHDSVYGEIDPVTHKAVKPGSFDELYDSYAERVPKSQRAEFLAKKETYRLRGSARLAALQYTGRQAYEKVEITKNTTRIIESIAGIDPNDVQTFEQFKQQGLDLIDKSGLKPLDKETAAANWKANADITLFKSALEKDPAFAAKARAALGLAPAAAPMTPGSYVDRIVGAESGGDPNAKNRLSSATGSGQFIKSTWKQFIRERHPELLAQGDIQKWRSSGALSREAVAWYAEKNTAELKAAGLPVTDGTLYLAHFAGPEGAKALLSANPDAHAETVLGSEVIRANPFLRGMSASQVVAWAEKKMTGTASASVPAGPRFADIPFDDRVTLAHQADTKLRESYPEMKAVIQQTEQDALTSYQREGTYKGTEPGIDAYTAAYGQVEGETKFREYQNDKAVAKTVNTFTSASETEIKTTIASAEAAIPAGPGAGEGQANLTTLQTAANTVMKAREKPAEYVMQNFDSVKEAWKAFNPAQPDTAKSAIALMVETQRHLGIPEDKIEPMPGAAIDAARAVVEDNNRPAAARLDALVGMVLITSDPAQQRAIFDQLVKAGVPDKAEVAIDAYVRGDTGAARRMFEAAMVKPDDIPGKNVRDTGFDDALSAAMFDPGTIGEAFYALDYRDPRTTAVAQRDFELAKSAATLSMLTGKSQGDAIDQAIHDIQGSVVRVQDEFSNGGGVLGIVPEGTNVDQLTAGMEAAMPQVMAAAGALKAQALSSVFGASLPKNPVGLLTLGNIDLGNRPVVKNADGTISTVKSMSFEDDGKEILVPTVSDDGKMLSEKQAIELYRSTGKHLGIFDNAANATTYAQSLHESQAALYGVSPETRNLLESAHGFELGNLTTEGVFRPYGDGWGFYDPYSNAFLPGSDGKALVWSTEELTRKGAAAPAPVPVERDPAAIGVVPVPSGTGMFGAPQ